MIRNMSVKKKIVFWFSFTFLINLGIMLSLIYFISQSVFTTDIQTQLQTQVEANAAEIEYLNAGELEEEYEKGDQFLEYKKGYLEIDDDFCNYINGIYTCLVDSDNNLLYGEVPVRLDRSQVFTHTSVGQLTYRGEKYYIYERPLQGPNLDGLWIRGVADFREGTHLLSAIMNWALYLVPLMAVLCLLGGYVITRRAFAPAVKIMETADSISSGNDLSRRIEMPEGRDEFHTMANSYNRMFERLEAAFRREKQFTSDVSHELRTPVSVILSQCEFTLEEEDITEDCREALEVIQLQGLKMKDLISQLLFFSRLEQGREPLQIAASNLSQLAEQVCDEQEVIHSESTITLERELPENLIGPVDSRLFGRVLTNLISNGYRYGRAGGHIKVSLSCQPDAEQITLQVSDDGIGMKAEHLPRIFDRFYRADNARTSGSEAEAGAGLGLAMVKEIVQLHGGTVTCESVPDQGSTFTVTIPARL